MWSAMLGLSKPVVDGQRRGETRTLVATTAMDFRLWEYLWEMDYREEGKSEVLELEGAAFMRFYGWNEQNV
jgi:hypothetical protein